MKDPEKIAKKVMKKHYGKGSGWWKPNEHGERGFTRAQVETDIGEGEILELIVEGINAYCDQNLVKIAQWKADHDGVHVVQIDTAIGGGRIRVNLNDAPIWDGDPEEDPRPGAHFHDVWEEPDPAEEEARRRAALEILHKHALPADAPSAWVRAAIDNELKGPS